MDFNSEYYFLSAPADRGNLPYLTPDEDTIDRDFRYAKQDPFSPPLFFWNGSKEYKAKKGIQTVRIPPRILFAGSNILVTTEMHDRLLTMGIPDMVTHPAVYTHDDDNWYEDYWFLAFTERFDCWDRANSICTKTKPLQIGGFELAQVLSYSLNADLLSKVPLEKRLFFQMGGTLDASFVCHKSLLPLLKGDDGNGAQFTLIEDF